MKRIIETDQAPKAIGPYSQAVSSSNHEWIFLSGQIPLDPKTMTIVSDDVQEQTQQVIENLKAILSAAGSTLAHVVKTTIFLKDMNDFARVNSTYEKYFHDYPPARSTVEVARLPRDVKIEIEAVALQPAAIKSTSQNEASRDD